MKIILPVHHFLPNYNGGAEQYTLRLAHQLQKLGHQVEVVCIESIEHARLNHVLARLDYYQGIPVWRLSFSLMGQPQPNRAHYYNEILGDWFGSYFENCRPDLAHIQGGYLIGVAPLYAASAAGIPTVLTLHDYWFLCPRITLRRGDGSLCVQVPQNPAACAWCQLLESRRYRLLDRMTGGMAGWIAPNISLHAQREVIADRRSTVLAALAVPNAVIAPSRFLAERVAPFVQPGRLHISRLGLDLTATPRQQPVSLHSDLKVGFIGQIAPHKGVHLLITAFRRMQAPDRCLELHIHGDLDVRTGYAKYLRRLTGNDPRIFFHGRFDNHSVADILHGFDVLVVPSDWYEVGPLTIYEAQAVGVPVVASAIGNIVDLVRNGVDGLLFTAGSPADLARQLQRLIDDPNMLSALQANIMAPRSMEDEIRQLTEIYSSVSARI